MVSISPTRRILEHQNRDPGSLRAWHPASIATPHCNCLDSKTDGPPSPSPSLSLVSSEGPVGSLAIRLVSFYLCISKLLPWGQTRFLIDGLPAREFATKKGLPLIQNPSHTGDEIVSQNQSIQITATATINQKTTAIRVIFEGLDPVTDNHLQPRP